MALCKKISESWKGHWEFFSDYFYQLPEGIKTLYETLPRPCVYAYILFAIFFLIFVGGGTFLMWMLAALAVISIVLLSGIFIGPFLAVVGLICPNLLCCENRREVLQDCSIITAISAVYHLAKYISSLTQLA
ncbi:hypothetical protein NG798_25990 [Ancylothrix sp. C2]|nr:hypothetical protein [Ancylothrix sp. D3o]